MLKRLLRVVEGGLWIALVALLPLTSLPLVRAVFGTAMVAPPSAFPLLGLVVIFSLPALLRGGSLPPQSRPLLAFCVAALVSSLAAYFIVFPIFRDNNFTRHMLEAGLTLAVGLSAYLVSSTWAASEKRLQTTLRWINWSGLVMLAWALLQGAVTGINFFYPEWMDQVQAVFSVATLYWNRATGFALEPSWLAHQLNMLYLPLWLAATVRRSSAHRLRVWGISFENALLVAGVAALWLSVSRIGLLAFLLTMAYLLVLANLGLLNWVQNRLLPRLAGWARRARQPGPAPAKPNPQRWARWLLRLELVLLLLTVYLALFFGAAELLRRLDPRMRRVFDFSTIAQNGIMQYANQLLFAERIVYWQTGWEVFNDHPWLGVGLGNTGYFFMEKLNPFGWALPELNRVLLRENSVPNTKSLWSRLLSDTGLVGFGLFLSWLVTIFLTGRSLEKSAARQSRMLGLAAQLTVVALLLEGFSVDTFALPYFWLTFGLATAAWWGWTAVTSPWLKRFNRSPAIFKSHKIA